jgi:hypothetical protein
MRVLTEHGRKRIWDKLFKARQNQFITLTEAGERYCPVGENLSFCRCTKQYCNKSKTCKCRKMGKFCTSICHNGSGKNLLRKNFPAV